ncbi:MAG: hypothetical protein U5L45_08840 [Saprospiraceae bacterium]|nr:hypothetical protein [Saprospiraceae bacterium]
MKPYIKSKLLVLALASLARRGECGSFFGLCPKNEPPLPLFCVSEASAKVPFNAYFEFMYGFKKFKKIKAQLGFQVALINPSGFTRL